MVSLVFSGCNYQEGYDAGRKAGYSSGHEDGESSGKKSGYSDGRKDGWVSGYGSGTTSFVKSRWLPSIGLAAVSAIALIVLFVIVMLFRLLIYPPIALIVERIRRRISSKWTQFEEARQRRRYLLKLKAAEEIKVQIFATKLASKAQAAIHDERTLDKFEKMLHDLRKEVSEEHWDQIKDLGAKWGEIASQIDNNEKLHPSDKESLRKELIANYHESIATEKTI